MSGLQSTAESGIANVYPETLTPEMAEDFQRAEWQWSELAGDAGLRLWDLPVRSDGNKTADGRDSSFWHLVTDTVQVRRLSPGRMAMLGRVWELLELLSERDPRALWWREPWKDGYRLLVAPDSFRLLVVLRPDIGKRRGSFTIVTAFPSDKYRAVHLRERYEASWASGESFDGCFGLVGSRRRRRWRDESRVLRLPAAGVRARLRRELVEAWE